MWSSKKSVTLSLLLCRVFAVLLIIGIAALPSFEFWIINNFSAYKNTQDLILPTVTAFYICVIPAFTALFCLVRLLKNIRSDNVFIEQNVTFLRIISWCCAAVSIVSFIFAIITCCMLYYTPAVAFFVISVAAVFVFIILRVIKNVMCAAVELKKENDMTI